MINQISKLLFTILIFTSVLCAQKVSLGIDVLQKNNFNLLKGKNVGLITNHTGVNSKLETTLKIFQKTKEFKLNAVFSPEHGLKGVERAGIKFNDSTDNLTGLKFYSLYGATHKPTKEMLEGIDVLVYDIQDIGVRSYTYISTLSLAMEAAAENKIEFIVLDRPNPLGGLKLEGNVVEDKYVSFVSKFKIPYVYGLTCGELALMLNKEKMLSKEVECDLKVVPMENWNRTMKFEDTGLMWIPTSPNVPYQSTPFHLVATGILGELQVMGIGISYTIPFQTFAAEWIDEDLFCDEMNKLNLPGVLFSATSFKPMYGQFQDKVLNGVQIHFTNYDEANLTSIQFYLMQVHHKLYPNKDILKMATSSRIKMFDKVLGTDKIRKRFSKHYKVSSIKSFLDKDINRFRNLSKKYYLYN